MNELVELYEVPTTARYMIAGWQQWANAGDVSSGLPQYLIDTLTTQKIGEIKPDNFYLFQIPALHHLLRPVVKLRDGYRQSLKGKGNAFFHAKDNEDGALIFLGEEPHRSESRYAKAFLDAVEALGVERVAIVAGVHSPVPYDKDREISCVYSLPEMKKELDEYAVKFSNYEGGATIGIVIADEAEKRDIEVIALYAMIPAYDFSRPSIAVQQIAIEEDFKAWYDLMVRLNHMFHLDIDLADLKERSEDLILTWDARIRQLENKMPQLEIQDYMNEVYEDFEELSFSPLSRAWGEAVDDIFDKDQPR